MDKNIIEKYVDAFCHKIVLPTFMEYIKTPNLSPNYDPYWNTNGNQDQAAKLLHNWVEEQNIKGLRTNKIMKDLNRTSLIFIEVDSFNTDSNKSLLVYGHFDKQPYFTGWSPDHGPTDPVIIDGKLYGRGAADDGYAIFAIISAILTCQSNKYSHPKITIIIEGAEESYQKDLFNYLEQIIPNIKTPDLVICLDSGGMDYLRLWAMTCVRGVISLNLKVTILEQGIHSGCGGGLIPDSFMIMRELLDRLEYSNTGLMKDSALYVDIPKERQVEIELLAEVLGDSFIKNLPLYENTQPLFKDIKELLTRNTWTTTMAVLGQSGFPESILGGNVLRQLSELRVSFRLPPTLNAKFATDRIIKTLTDNPPFGAKVEIDVITSDNGWNMEIYSDNLKRVMGDASKMFFGKNYLNELCAATVPFLKTISQKFPKSEILCTGAIGFDSNIHGPNENLDVAYFQKFICCLSYILNNY